MVSLMISWSLARGMSMAFASSSSVGSLPRSTVSCLRIRFRRFTVSTMWTGTRIVRAWSAMALVMACRIHQVA